MAFDTAISQYKEYRKDPRREYWIPYMRKHPKEREKTSGIETS
jgi:hypothetical protein